MAKRKSTKVKAKSAAKPVGPELPALITELEAIRDQLKTSTVTFSKERLQRVIKDLRKMESESSE